MSDLARQSIAQMQQIRGDLMRYEATVPQALSYLEWLSEDGNAQGAIKLDMLESYLNTLSQFLKLVHRVNGNFPFELFQSDDTVRLMSWGYTLVYGLRLITYTKAQELLGISYFKLYRMVYPNTGEPLLTAYFDPMQKIRGHGSRLLIDEVQKVKENRLTD